MDWAEVRRVGINGYVEDPEKYTWEEEKEEKEEGEEEKEKEDRCLREYGSQPCV